jgi:D-sedoheptulose 7-phosphate isomerase
MSFREYLQSSIEVLQRTADTLDSHRIDAAVGLIVGALSAKRSFLVCGNGGSASDAMHITGELVARFLKERKAYRAICLGANPAVMTAWANDKAYDTTFAREVEAYGEEGAVLLGISTSGNSPNIVNAFETARSLGVRTIALTGEGGGKLAPLSDILLDIPSRYTPLIQQAHICLYHHLCERIETELAAAEG